MVNLITVIKGHYYAGLDHCVNYNINHKVTWAQAVHATLLDLLKFKIITLDDSYIVYEVVNKPTLGIKLAQVVSVYVPKQHRGRGIGSQLLNMVPYKTVIMAVEDEELQDKYQHIGSIALVRRDIC